MKRVLMIVALAGLPACGPKLVLTEPTTPLSADAQVEIAEDSGVEQVCVQWMVTDREGVISYPYRCVNIDSLRRVLFPEEFD